MKKKITLWLVLFMCHVSTQCLAHDFEVDGIFYNILSQDTIAVTYYGDSYSSAKYSGNITIPQSVAYNEMTYRVTSIGSNAFYKCSGLTSITIPSNVTSIGMGAFSGCI